MQAGRSEEGLYLTVDLTHPASCLALSPPVQISLSPSMSMTTSDGTEYIAKQMHFHWGGASAEVGGSEHTVDGIRRVIEVVRTPTGPLSFQPHRHAVTTAATGLCAVVTVQLLRGTVCSHSLNSYWWITNSRKEHRRGLCPGPARRSLQPSREDTVLYLSC